jgi:hypothetical protein
MFTDDDIVAALCTVAGLFCLVKGAIALAAEGGRWLASLEVAAWVIGIAALTVAVLPLYANRQMRTQRVTIDAGGDIEDAIDHEVAHALAGDAEGAQVVSAEVRPDGSGVCRLRWDSRPDPVSQMAVSAAGAYGEGASFDSPQCRGDRRNYARHRSRVPFFDRGAADSDAHRRARSATGGSRPGWASAMARDLRRSGHYRG